MMASLRSTLSFPLKFNLLKSKLPAKLKKGKKKQQQKTDAYAFYQLGHSILLHIHASS